MEETLSGFRQRGTWAEVVEHGERVVEALRETDADADAIDAFDDWRPKPHDRIDEEVSEKTAAQASVDEGEGERAGQGAEEDLQTAGERLSESYQKLEDADTEGAVERWEDSLEHVARAVDTAGRKALRTVEKGVYRTVMTQIAPYYFDNELVSANLQRVRSQEEFVFEVNITDDDLKQTVADRLHEYEDLDRWHVDTDRKTIAVEAAEGIDTPEQSSEPNSPPRD
ncbi:MAG: DUF5828 family protein [Halobacteriaceae archaeon]